eukprot:977287-Pyramimonas_sp.AAC.2
MLSLLAAMLIRFLQALLFFAGVKGRYAGRSLVSSQDTRGICLRGMEEEEEIYPALAGGGLCVTPRWAA